MPVSADSKGVMDEFQRLIGTLERRYVRKLMKIGGIEGRATELLRARGADMEPPCLSAEQPDPPRRITQEVCCSQGIFGTRGVLGEFRLVRWVMRNTETFGGQRFVLGSRLVSLRFAGTWTRRGS